MDNLKIKSLGSLRAVDQPTKKHPRFLGQLKLQRQTVEVIARQLGEYQLAEITCSLAGWINQDAKGSFLTIAVTPKVTLQSIAVDSSPFAELLGNEDHQNETDHLSETPPWDD